MTETPFPAGISVQVTKHPTKPWVVAIGLDAKGDTKVRCRLTANEALLVADELAMCAHQVDKHAKEKP